MKTLSSVKLCKLCRISLFLPLMGISLGLHAEKPSATVTKGSFVTYATGLDRGYDISGHATMVRAPGGRTIVTTHVRGYGIFPNTQYGSHVHKQACSDSNGGGHYQDEEGGAVDNVNEIWPILMTNSHGIGNGYAMNHFIAREEAQSVVVHDTDGARIACADLE